jgi:hypothetical protein
MSAFSCWNELVKRVDLLLLDLLLLDLLLLDLLPRDQRWSTHSRSISCRPITSWSIH